MQTMPPDGPWTEVPSDLDASERAAAFEKYFDWLSTNSRETLGLPEAALAYLVLELCSGDNVPESLGGGVGVSVICDPHTGFHDELRMVVAVGSKERETDIADFYARLTTIAHEMEHLADFWRIFEGSPAQAARNGDIGRWPALQADCHGPIEDVARELTTLYTDTENIEWAE